MRKLACKSFRSSFCGLFFLLLFTSCNGLINNKVCTLEFVCLGVSVTTAKGEPVVLDEVTISHGRTGKVFDLCKSETNCDSNEVHGAPEAGMYTLFHDGLRSKVGMVAMPVVFEGKNESLQVNQLFAIEDNGCHVRKAGGPSTIIAEPRQPK